MAVRVLAFLDVNITRARKRIGADWWRGEMRKKAVSVVLGHSLFWGRDGL